jgi:hypothetical protein
MPAALFVQEESSILGNICRIIRTGFCYTVWALVFLRALSAPRFMGREREWQFLLGDKNMRALKVRNRR